MSMITVSHHLTLRRAFLTDTAWVKPATGNFRAAFLHDALWGQYEDRLPVNGLYFEEYCPEMVSPVEEAPHGSLQPVANKDHRHHSRVRAITEAPFAYSQGIRPVQHTFHS